MSSNYTPEEKQAILEALVKRGRSLAAEAKSMNEEVSKIKDRIDQLVEVGWTLVVDGLPARKSKGNRSFSHELAVGHFSPEERASCRSEGLDSDKVRELAKAKGLIEACMIPADAEKASVKLT